jgi:hypothetical protein
MESGTPCCLIEGDPPREQNPVHTYRANGTYTDLFAGWLIVLRGFDEDCFQGSGWHMLGQAQDLNPDKIVVLIIIEDYSGPDLFRVMDTAV